ncbi:MAG: macro domain-containing protein [Acidobacteria bacterium]|nr:macro domain-containing protein [Acidobacteriota bacterium]
MNVEVTLVDVNPKMVAAFRHSFEENPEVTILAGSMLAQDVDAWVTPTNARGSMDGGLDAVIKQALGGQIEARVQAEIKRLHGGLLPVGHATCVATGRPKPRFLISTPTMFGSSEDISDSLNVALACAAAFQVIHMHNARAGGGIASVALPGLGANTGKVPVEICADLMWTGYSLFRRREFESFTEMRAALEEELGPLGAPGPKPKGKVAVPGAAPGTPKPAPAADPDADFDDADDDE